MSVSELKEEFKQSEGDPMIKGKIRQLRMARMRKRMIAQVPKASVVIMNAVALQYDRGMNAPICLAKGLSATALKIRKVVEEHDIPVVENPPLARALYAVVEIDEEIPAEHYKAVAEIIGYHAAEPFSAGFPVEHPGRESDYYRSTRAGQTNGDSGH
jgi:flagellar biosynthetic protein FlhB